MTSKGCCSTSTLPLRAMGSVGSALQMHTLHGRLQQQNKIFACDRTIGDGSCQIGAVLLRKRWQHREGGRACRYMARRVVPAAPALNMHPIMLETHLHPVQMLRELTGCSAALSSPSSI